ncbi:glycoside hydrolase family 43 protein [Loktanella sp. TSTF-M6]|uniref:Glycoside hydrolase family 43 protein n=1 Tax=Loktanella gaetbuli TaxID=2881335 RepID=A0ABS8BRS4_9RHOB|nr:glycoside hydrolase family 43 protein [Loktanella gaetbuli]MCB5198447.1 glycoside hydrolase family 43 protein [Loktanella gaetbuli]
MIRNPILPGFNADPSICRVGDDYYIATSTFEWYPGVQIHHSRDLVNWTLVSRPLNRAALLDMRGNPDSCGIWAPCLSYADKRFWLVYTDVKRLEGDWKDAHNYITTCGTIDGDWSDPWYVNSSGFDPSLFHDDDGRKWFVNMQWNHRQAGSGVNPANDRFDGILLQEWSPARGLFGPVTNIYHGTDRGLTEAPHLFKRNGWYYLTTAEGGTGYDHAVTLSRSRQIDGPYEDHPDKHVISTKGVPNHPIQRAGHGQYVEAPDGTAWHTYLMGRPVMHDGKPFCATGRETGIARCVWRDDWLYLEHGGLLPPETVDIDVTQKPRDAVIHDRFDSLPSEFQWLRTPQPDRLFRVDDGALVLIGRESIGSWFEQSLVARRQEDPAYTVETTLDFAPQSYQQGAGLITYYNRHKFHGAFITYEDGQRCLTLISCNGDWPAGALDHPIAPVPIPDGPVTLSVQVAGAYQQFHFDTGDGAQPLGPPRDASHISDEGAQGEHASFTGAFVGMMAYDITGMGAEARYTRFAYTPQEFDRTKGEDR